MIYFWFFLDFYMSYHGSVCFFCFYLQWHICFNYFYYDFLKFRLSFLIALPWFLPHSSFTHALCIFHSCSAAALILLPSCSACVPCLPSSCSAPSLLRSATLLPHFYILLLSFGFLLAFPLHRVGFILALIWCNPIWHDLLLDMTDSCGGH